MHHVLPSCSQTLSCRLADMLGCAGLLALLAFPYGKIQVLWKSKELKTAKWHQESGVPLGLGCQWSQLPITGTCVELAKHAAPENLAKHLSMVGIKTCSRRMFFNPSKSMQI